MYNMFKFLKSIVKSTASGIYKDPELQKLMSRHPRFFGFIKKRLTPDEQFGLYLTIGALITLFFVYLFFGIIQDLIGQAPLIQSDLRIINLMQILRKPSFNNEMLFVTYLGKWQIVFLGTTLAAIILALVRRWRYFFALLASVVGSEIFVWLLAHLIHRSRPPLVNALAPEMTYSFPSGHGFVAFSFYGLIAYFIVRTTNKKLVKILAVLGGVAIVAVIGFSRIYLGAHWPSDVLASYASGVAWLAAIITALEIRHKFKPKTTEPLVAHSTALFLSSALFVVWSGYYFNFYATHPLIPRVILPPENQLVIEEKNIPTAIFNMLPKTSETLTGSAMEPIQMIVVAKNDDTFVSEIENAGWYLADQPTLANLAYLAKTAYLNENYPTAPMTPSFWNTEPHDFGFQKSTDKQSIRERHHARFWRTPLVTPSGNHIYVGTASLDVGIKWLVTHKIDPDIDTEREFIFSSFEKAGLIASFEKKQLVSPTLGKNSSGDQFFTDGKAYFIFFK